MSDSWVRNGDPVRGQSCPRCGRISVKYNGNYSCSECSWVMGDAGQPRRIVKAYLSQRWLKAKAEGDQSEMDRIGVYLIQYM